MADVCGPWTLDQLDAFGTVDSIEITFDSPIWQSADTCILSASASVTGVGDVLAAGNGVFAFSATVTGIGTLTGQAIRVRLAEGDIVGVATVSGDPIRIRMSAASITGVGTASALGGKQFLASGEAVGVGIAEALAFAVFDSSGSVIGFALADADGTVIGEEWTTLEPGSEVWKFKGDGICGPFTLDQLDVFGGVDELPFSLDSPIYLRPDFCASVEVWQNKPEGTNTWLQKG
jgi:hypothetical protein